MYFSWVSAAIRNTLSNACLPHQGFYWVLHKYCISNQWDAFLFMLVKFLVLINHYCGVFALWISLVSQRVQHCDISLELLVDEAGASAWGRQPFPCRFSHGGFLTARLFISFQTNSCWSWWKSKSHFLCVRGFFPGKSYTTLNNFWTELNSLFSKALIRSRKPEMYSEIFPFLPALCIPPLMSHLSEESVTSKDSTQKENLHLMKLTLNNLCWVCLFLSELLNHLSSGW